MALVEIEVVIQTKEPFCYKRITKKEKDVVEKLTSEIKELVAKHKLGLDSCNWWEV